MIKKPPLSHLVKVDTHYVPAMETDIRKTIAKEKARLLADRKEAEQKVKPIRKMANGKNNA